jgi:tetratricopeptide (TPR) repeat protein
VALSAEHGFALWGCLSEIYTHYSKTGSDDLDRAIEALQERIAFVEMTGTRLFRSFYDALLARTCLLAGRLTEATAALEHGLAHADEYDERIYEPALRQLKGEIAAELGDLRNARAHFDQALQLAESQGSTLLELQAATAAMRRFPEAEELRQRAEHLYRALRARGETCAYLDEVDGICG